LSNLSRPQIQPSAGRFGYGTPEAKNDSPIRKVRKRRKRSHLGWPRSAPGNRGLAPLEPRAAVLVAYALWAIGWAMVSASYVLETAPAHTDMLASEPDRSDARRATGLTLERRPRQKATVSGGGNNSIEA